MGLVGVIKSTQAIKSLRAAAVEMIEHIGAREKTIAQFKKVALRFPRSKAKVIIMIALIARLSNSSNGAERSRATLSSDAFHRLDEEGKSERSILFPDSRFENRDSTARSERMHSRIAVPLLTSRAGSSLCADGR